MLMASEKPGFSDRRCVRGPLSGGVRAGGTCLSAAVLRTGCPPDGRPAPFPPAARETDVASAFSWVRLPRFLINTI